MIDIPFNRPYATGAEFTYIREAIDYGHLSGNGPFSERCCRWLEERVGAVRALLAHSCTGALEMAALLADVGPGDEVVLPSYTFVSTANAFALRGATPVFVDIRADTLNLDERKVEAALTPRTKALVAVHYAGVGCAMHELTELSDAHGVMLVEDAAQGALASYRGRPLGSFGALAALSFHETKNVIAGEGGALLVNEPSLVEHAEVVQEKGTDRSAFFRGQVDKYTWRDLGGSYAPSEINAAFLWAQLERAEELTARRLEIWSQYHDAFEELEHREALRRPVVPHDCVHNAHMYYVLLPEQALRDRFIAELAERGIMAVFHYVPLHVSVAGKRYGRASGELRVSEDVSERLVRLPLWVGMTDEHVSRVVEAVTDAAAKRVFTGR